MVGDLSDHELREIVLVQVLRIDVAEPSAVSLHPTALTRAKRHLIGSKVLVPTRKFTSQFVLGVEPGRLDVQSIREEQPHVDARDLVAMRVRSHDQRPHQPLLNLHHLTLSRAKTPLADAL
jgi:hypothetical protein